VVSVLQDLSINDVGLVWEMEPFVARAVDAEGDGGGDRDGERFVCLCWCRRGLASDWSKAFWHMKTLTRMPLAVFVMPPGLHRLARTKGFEARTAGLAQVFRLPTLFHPVNSILDYRDSEVKNSCGRHTEERALALKAVVERPK